MPRSFYVFLLGPIVLMAISAGLMAFWENDIGPQASMVITGLDYLFMIVSALVCAVMVADRKDTALGVWTFVGLIALYLGVALAGCVHFVEEMYH